MRRRHFITCLSLAFVWPGRARAQPADRVRRIGVLFPFAENDAEVKSHLSAFSQELKRLGWSQDRNIRFDVRYAAGMADQYRALAKELAALQPDVFLSESTPAAGNNSYRVCGRLGPGWLGLRDEFGATSGRSHRHDAIREWHFGEVALMLKEVAPHLTRVAFVANPKFKGYDYFWRFAQTAAPALAIELIPSQISNDAADVERAIETFARMPDGGPSIRPRRHDHSPSGPRHCACGTPYRLPAVYPWRFFVPAGGLMSYGIDNVDVLQKAASYVDRILRGAKPADLPVQAPATKFEAAVNLKIARALGLTIPASLVATADQVIE